MLKLRPYQNQAVDKVIAHFKKSRDPCMIVLPTGAGKSVVIAELARIAKGRVLVAAHVKELVEQNQQKFESYGAKAGIYSAGLKKKDHDHKVIFGSIQSIARAKESFFKNFSLLIIDECHRVDSSEETQYGDVIKKLKEQNPGLCILGLTATPYRLGLGYIYEFSHLGVQRSTEKRFFKKCVYELPLEYMIKNKFLTQPVKIDIPVTCYDFSELSESDKMYSHSQVEELLTQQRQLTPLIIKNIVDITESFKRRGVMIFSSTVRHAKDILQYLPPGQAEIILGDTDSEQRDKIIERFKEKKFKYLVNVSVLTTGFDAPHVDVVAILRPTESVSLYQQIIGRGLRIDSGKQDCFILDYTGMGHDIYAPEITEKKPSRESVPVYVTCPSCGFENTFWGLTTDEGEVIEHYGRKCRGAFENPQTAEYEACGYRFRFKICNQCGHENDITARECVECKVILIDPDTKLKQARLSKNAHVLTPDSVKIEERQDKNGNFFLDVKYYDFDAKYFSEIHYINNDTSLKKFNINFLRSHMRRPELSGHISSTKDVIKYQKLLRMPKFIIARKQDKYWKITEKIFSEEI